MWASPAQDKGPSQVLLFNVHLRGWVKPSEGLCCVVGPLWNVPLGRKVRRWHLAERNQCTAMEVVYQLLTPEPLTCVHPQAEFGVGGGAPKNLDGKNYI